MAVDLYIVCLGHLSNIRHTPIVVEQEVEEGSEDQKDVESDRQGFVGSDGECRFLHIIVVLLLDQPVDLASCKEDNGQERVIVGSIDDYF